MKKSKTNNENIENIEKAIEYLKLFGKFIKTLGDTIVTIKEIANSNDKKGELKC